VDEFELAKKHSEKADVIICLGTSLRVTPANGLPLLPLKKGGKLVIVNLQQTPKDKKATIKLHAKCDLVMEDLMVGLGNFLGNRHSHFFLKIFLLQCIK
jgi:mono-ADP-ribosyltransferase sirtuin 6